MNIRIDPEFKDYLGPLDEDARQVLEASLRAEGCRDALVVWPQPDGGAILLDGHNRYDICERLGRAIRTVNCPDSVTDRAGAVAWIVQNQRGRRNLTKDQLTYLMGKMHEIMKKEAGGNGSNQHTEQCYQNDSIARPTRTAERLAREFGVSAPTVYRAEKFANQVDAVATEHGPEAKTEILSGRAKISDYRTPLYPELEPLPEIVPPPPGEAPPSRPAPPLKRSQQTGLDMIAKLRDCAEAIRALRDLGLPAGATDPAVRTTIFHVREALCALERHLNQEPEE